MTFSVNRTIIALVVLLSTLVITIWHSRGRIGLDMSLEDIRPYEWIGDKGRSTAKSEAIYQKTLQQRRDLLEETYPDSSQMPFFPAIDGHSYGRTPFTIWDFFPASYNCPFEIQRLGRMGDGGKWTCGMSRYMANKAKPCVIYSFGVQTESSFEQEFLERTNCEIWGYDYSVTKWGPQIDPVHINTRAHFLQAAIGPSNPSSSPPTYSIKDLMRKNGHKYIDIMKMDIEGWEYPSLTAFLNDFQYQELPLGQLMIEIHLSQEIGLQNTPTPAGFLDWVEALEARGMRPVWTEPNLLSVTMHFDGSMPSMAEYTLINTKDRHSLLLP